MDGSLRRRFVPTSPGARAPAFPRARTFSSLMLRASDQANEFDIHWYERNPDYNKYEQTFLLNVEVRCETAANFAVADP